MYSEDDYEKFAKHMEEKFPKMFSQPYGGFAIGAGWWPVIEKLCSTIQSHIDWKIQTRERLLEANPYNHDIPEEVEPVVVQQIKEKFGSLRFYYSGGDEYVSGAVNFAESMSVDLCEECGAPGKRRDGGWIRTLCDQHENEYQERKLLKEGFEQ
jgi:hypothetical protein